MYRIKLNYSLCIALFIALFAGVACNKIEDLLRFSFKDSVEFTIPSQSIITNVPVKIASPEVQTSSQQAFSNNNTQAKYVKTASLQAMKLTITVPQDQTFSFLNEIKIYMSAADQPEVLLASRTNIPATIGNELELEVTGENLKPYIQGDSYSIRTEVRVDEVTTREITIKADMTFSVTADVF